MIRDFVEFCGYYHDLNLYLLENFNYDLLNEGLIKSSSYNIAVDKINNLIKKYNIRGVARIYIGKDRVEIIFDNTEKNINYKQFYKDFQSILRVLGYYISISYVDNVKKSIEVQDLVKNKNFKIWINKRFDCEADIQGIPEILYHVTPSKNLDKIKKQGLKSMSEKLIQEHPERIYLFGNLSDAEEFIITRNEYIDTEYIILKIEIILSGKMKLYFDPKYEKDTSAYYTYDNIHPNAISIAKK